MESCCLCFPLVQSIPCYLEGVRENSQEALDLFSNLAFEKSGVVRVIKR